MTTTFRGIEVETHTWCIRSDHWSNGEHPLGDLSDPRNPIWDEACKLSSVTLAKGALLSISTDVQNAAQISAQVLASSAEGTRSAEEI